MQHATIADLLIHLRLEDADRASRMRFGAEQRRTGIGEQRCCIAAVARIKRNAHCQARAHRLAVDRELIGHRLNHAPGESDPGIRLVAVDDQAKLVTAEAGDDAAACRRFGTARNFDKHFVAHGMAIDIVDLLQAVEIDAEHGELLVGTRASLDHLRQ